MANQTYTLAELNADPILAEVVRKIARKMIAGTYHLPVTSMLVRTAAKIVKLKTGKVYTHRVNTFQGTVTFRSTGETFARYTDASIVS